MAGKRETTRGRSSQATCMVAARKDGHREINPVIPLHEFVARRVAEGKTIAQSADCLSLCQALLFNVIKRFTGVLSRFLFFQAAATVLDLPCPQALESKRAAPQGLIGKPVRYRSAPRHCKKAIDRSYDSAPAESDATAKAGRPGQSGMPSSQETCRTAASMTRTSPYYSLGVE